MCHASSSARASRIAADSDGRENKWYKLQIIFPHPEIAMFSVNVNCYHVSVLISSYFSVLKGETTKLIKSEESFSSVCLSLHFISLTFHIVNEGRMLH